MYQFHSSVPAWIALLQQQSYATLRLDSFTARGYSTGMCSNAKAVSYAERGLDALAAAYVLAGRPDVRRDRIAVIGWSHGAAGGVYPARDHDDLRPWREKLATRGGKVVASVALYGDCDGADGYPGVVPLLLLLAAKDDWEGRSRSRLARWARTGNPRGEHDFAVDGVIRSRE
jgi:dienelactone hydrolase